MGRGVIPLGLVALSLSVAGCVSSGSGVAGPSSNIIVTGFSGQLHVSADRTSTLTVGHGFPIRPSTAAFISTTTVVAAQRVDGGTAIVKSFDGGRTWAQISVLPGDVTHFDFPTAVVGYATVTTGGGTSLYATSNGGVAWSKVYSAMFVQIGFVSGNKGFAIVQPSLTGRLGSAGLYETSDGGRSWSPVHSSIEPGMLDGAFSFVGNSYGWFMGGTEPSAGSEAKYLYGTTNGGRTWSLISSTQPSRSQQAPSPGQLSLGGYITAIKFISPTKGYAIFNRAGLFETIDGGRSWNPVHESGISDHSLRNPLAFSAWEPSGFSLATVNSSFWEDGVSGSWVRTYPPYRSSGVFAGPTGLFSLSIDGELQSVQSLDAARPVGIVPAGTVEIDPLAGEFIALGANGLYKSATGAQWIKMGFPRGMSARQGGFINPGFGVVAAYRSTDPSAGSFLEVTGDGGASWKEIKMDFGLLEVDPVSPLEWWALGHPQETATGSTSGSLKPSNNGPLWNLYHTSDGGRSWSELAANWPEPGGLDFLGAESGYVWSSSSLYQTLNGGRSFVRYPLPQSLKPAGPFSLTFQPGGSGWSSGSSAYYPIYHTIDSGGHWGLIP